MNRVWTLAILIIVGFFSINLGINWLGVRNRLDTQIFGSRFIELDDRLEYSVVPENDFLNIVIIDFKNPGLANHGSFHFSILDPEGHEIRHLEFSGWNIGDPGSVRFQFEPIPNSSGRNFIILIKAEPTEDPSIKIAVDKEGNLAFSTYYRTLSKKAVLSNLLSFWAKRVSNDIGFFSFWILTLGITIWLRKERK